MTEFSIGDAVWYWDSKKLKIVKSNIVNKITTIIGENRSVRFELESNGIEDILNFRDPDELYNDLKSCKENVKARCLPHIVCAVEFAEKKLLALRQHKQKIMGEIE